MWITAALHTNIATGATLQSCIMCQPLPKMEIMLSIILSLNQEQRQRDNQRVARENRQLLKRLEKVEPMYKVSSWVDDWQRKGELASMITAYPERMDAAAIPVANKV